jgi:hypothetical protein
MFGTAAATLGGEVTKKGLLSSVNPYIGMAQLGIGLMTSISGAGAERAAGRRQMGYIGEQQAMLEGAGQQVGELAGMKTELAEDIYGTGLDQAMYGTGENLYGLTKQGMGLSSKVGFAKSGQVDKQIARGQEAAVTQFGFQKQGLQDVLGQKLMDISEWKGAEQGRIASEQARLKYEMEEAQAKSKKKFLGIF